MSQVSLTVAANSKDLPISGSILLINMDGRIESFAFQYHSCGSPGGGKIFSLSES